MHIIMFPGIVRPKLKAPLGTHPIRKTLTGFRRSKEIKQHGFASKIAT